MKAEAFFLTLKCFFQTSLRQYLYAHIFIPESTNHSPSGHLWIVLEFSLFIFHKQTSESWYKAPFFFFYGNKIAFDL